jgi:LPXTG-motif cell wall-anchored protein
MTPAPTSPLRWVPTLYFAQGLQFFVVMLIAGLMFKSMGVGNDAIARWTGVLGLAWVFKPLWSPFLELLRSKKLVIVAMQFTGAIGLGLIALALQLPVWFGLTIALLFVLAYASATHDIAADGLYMANLSDRQQAAYAGNPYPSYEAQITQLNEMYLGRARWGSHTVRNLVDVRAAFTVASDQAAEFATFDGRLSCGIPAGTVVEFWGTVAADASCNAAPALPDTGANTSEVMSLVATSVGLIAAGVLALVLLRRRTA